MRRLAIVIETGASIAWAIFVLNSVPRFDRLEWQGQMIILIGIPVCFGLGFLLIWAVDWVNAGFRQRHQFSSMAVPQALKLTLTGAT